MTADKLLQAKSKLVIATEMSNTIARYHRALHWRLAAIATMTKQVNHDPPALGEDFHAMVIPSSFEDDDGGIFKPA